MPHCSAMLSAMASIAMTLLSASLRRILMLTSTHFRSVAVTFRLLSSRLLARLASLLSVLSTQLTSVTAMLSRLCRTAAARFSARLQTSAPTFSFRIAKTPVNFAMVRSLLIGLLNAVFLRHLMRRNVRLVTFSMLARTIPSAS